MVVGKEKNTTKSKVKEALKIKQVQKRNGAMNRDTGMTLSKLWLDLVKGKRSNHNEPCFLALR